MPSQYGSYHNNVVNIGIHMVCVPIILMTSFLLVQLPLCDKPARAMMLTPRMWK